MKKIALPPASGMLLGLSRLYGLPSILIVGQMDRKETTDSAVEAIYSFLCKIAGLRIG